MRKLTVFLALSIAFFTNSQKEIFSDSEIYKTSFENLVNRSFSEESHKRLTACTPVSSFSENFNSVSIPNLPSCWEKLGNDGAVSTQAADANSTPNTLFIYSSGDKDIGMVGLPPVNNLGTGTHRLRFSMRGTLSVGGEVEVGYVSNSLNPSTFKLIQKVTASSLTYQTYLVTPGVINGNFEVLAFRHTGSPSFSVLIDDVSWEPIPFCLPPPSTTVSSVSATGAVVNWASPQNVPVNYSLYISTSTTAPTDATVPTAANVTAPYTVTNLNANTTYQVWVRSNCGSNGVSTWSSVQSFTTACAILTPPYTLNFDAASPPAIPSCTSLQNLNNDGSFWKTILAPNGYTGNVVAYRFDASNVANDWFYTNAISLLAGKSYVLRYKYGNNSVSYNEKLKIAIGTNATATSMTTVLADYPAVNDNFPRVHAIRFTVQSSGTYYVGFQAYSAADQFELYLDDISVTEATVAPTTLNTCVTVITPRIDDQNNTKWMVLTDVSGNIIGEINGNGNNLGDVTSKVYRNSGALRKDFYGHYYLDRNIEIKPTTQPSTPVSLRLYFTASELAVLQAQAGANVSSFTDISIFKNNDPCGSRLSGGAAKLNTVAATYGNDYVVSFNVSSFSSFFFASSTFSVLPANILSFSGSRQGSGNQLNWTVAQESGVLEYDVERSEDAGSNWTKVGNVVSLGNTTSQRNYGYTDKTITGLKQLYRLRQVDISGSAKLSNIISISAVKPTKIGLSGLFPNPAASKLNILVDAPQKNNVTIEVIDIVGRVIKSQRNTVEAGSNSIQLNVSSLMKGIYLIKLSCGENCETSVTQFIKE